jgi:hypothetical protein
MGNVWVNAIERVDGPDVAALLRLDDKNLMSFCDPYKDSTAEGKWRFNAIGYTLEAYQRDRTKGTGYFACFLSLVERFQGRKVLNEACARRVKKGKMAWEHTPFSFGHQNNLYDAMVVLLMSGAAYGNIKNCVTDRWAMMETWSMEHVALHMKRYLGAVEFDKLEMDGPALLAIPYSEWTTRTQQTANVFSRYLDWMACKPERDKEARRQFDKLVAAYDRKHPRSGLNAPRRDFPCCSENGPEVGLAAAEPSDFASSGVEGTSGTTTEASRNAEASQQENGTDDNCVDGNDDSA